MIETENYSRIDRALAMLHTGPDATASSLADALWLARILPLSGEYLPDKVPSPEKTVNSLPSPPTVNGDKSEEERSEGSTSSAASYRSEPHTGLDHKDRVYAPQTAVAGEAFIPATFITVPAADALPNRLALERALKPFLKRLPSRRLTQLDCERTAEASADRRAVTPVFVPLPERWFDVLLLVERSDAMEVWADTVRELHTLFGRHGAFRNIRVLRFAVTGPDKDTVSLFTASAQPISARAAVDPEGRRLCLFLTNGTSTEWGRHPLVEFVRTLGRRTVVAIVQMLPQSAWGHTELGEALERLYSVVPGAANASLQEVDPFTGFARRREDASCVPALTLESKSVARWASFVMSQRRVASPAIQLSERGIDETATSTVGTITERVASFRGTASPEAFQLLRILAGVPLTLPIMRLVQQSIDASRQQFHLAEVMLSGLIERVTPAGGATSPDQVFYDFIPEVRELLQGTLSSRESENIDDVMQPVQERLRVFVEAHTGARIHSFRALLSDPKGIERLPASARAFVEVSRKIYQNLGLLPAALHRTPGSEVIPSIIEARILEGHKRAVYAVALSADGKFALSGSDDETLYVWELDGFTSPRILKGHTSQTLAIAISSDGRRAISGSQGGTLRIWDLDGISPPRILEILDNGAYAIAISSDGRRAVSTSRSQMAIWDLNSGKSPRILEGHGSTITSIALSADGLFAVSGSEDNIVRIWDLERNMTPRILEGYGGSIGAVAMSADGRIALSGSDDNALRVWSLDVDGPPQVLKGHSGAIRAIAVSSDGRLAISGSDDKSVRVWSLNTNAAPRVLEGHSGTVYAVALSADGRRLVSGSEDKTLRIWDLSDTFQSVEVNRSLGIVPRTLTSLPTKTAVVSGLGRYVAWIEGAYSPHNVFVWDVETDRLGSRGWDTGTPYETWSVLRTALNAQGSNLQVTAKSNQIFAVAGGEVSPLIRELPPHKRPPWFLGPGVYNLSPDANHGIQGTFGGLQVWNLATGEIVRKFGIENWDTHPTAVALASDGRTAVACFGGGSIVVFPRGETLRVDGPVATMAASSDCTFALVLRRAGEVLCVSLERLSVGEALPISDATAIALSADGSHAAVGHRTGSLSVWDLIRKRCIVELSHGVLPVHCVSMSATGGQLVSASGQGLKFWDLSTLIREAESLSERKTRTPRVISLIGNPDTEQDSLTLEVARALELAGHTLATSGVRPDYTVLVTRSSVKNPYNPDALTLRSLGELSQLLDELDRDPPGPLLNFPARLVTRIARPLLERKLTQYVLSAKTNDVCFVSGLDTGAKVSLMAVLASNEVRRAFPGGISWKNPQSLDGRTGKSLLVLRGDVSRSAPPVDCAVIWLTDQVLTSDFRFDVPPLTDVEARDHLAACGMTSSQIEAAAKFHRGLPMLVSLAAGAFQHGVGFDWLLVENTKEELFIRGCRVLFGALNSVDLGALANFSAALPGDLRTGFVPAPEQSVVELAGNCAWLLRNDDGELSLSKNACDAISQLNRDLVVVAHERICKQFESKEHSLGILAINGLEHARVAGGVSRIERYLRHRPILTDCITLSRVATIGKLAPLRGSNTFLDKICEEFAEERPHLLKTIDALLAPTPLTEAIPKFYQASREDVRGRLSFEGKTGVVAVILIDIFEDLESASALANLLVNNQSTTFSIAGQVEKFNDQSISTAAAAHASAQLTLNADNSWTIPNVGITLSLAAGAIGSITISNTSEAFAVTTTIDSDVTTNIVATPPSFTTVYVNIDLSFSITGTAGASGNINGVGIAGTVSDGHTATLTFCQPVDGNLNTFNALKQAFSKIVFPLDPLGILNMQTGALSRAVFDGTFSAAVNVTYGLGDHTFAAPGVVSALNSAQNVVSLTPPSLEINAGVSGSVSYTHTDHFALVVNKSTATIATVNLVRALSNDIGLSTGITVGITTTNISVSVDQTGLTGLVQQVTGNPSLATSIASAASTAGNNLTSSLNAKLASWATDASGEIGLTASLDRQTNRATLFAFDADLTSPDLTTASWKALVAGDITKALAAGGLTLQSGSGVSESLKRSSTIQFQFFNFFKSTTVTDFFSNASAELGPDGTIRFHASIGDETNTTTKTAISAFRIYFVVTASQSTSATVSPADVDLRIELSEAGAQRKGATFADTLALAPRQAATSDAQRAIATYLRRHPNGVLTLVYDIKPSAYSNLTFSPYSGAKPGPLPHAADESNWTAFRSATTQLIPDLRVLISPLTFGNWVAFNRTAIDQPGSTIDPDRRQTGNITAGVQTLGGTSAPQLAGFFMQASQGFMNLCEDLASLANSSAQVTDLNQYNRLLAFLTQVITKDVFLDYGVPTAAALVHQLGIGTAQVSSTATPATDGSALTCTVIFS